jgi:acyl-lipid omega-6 desaturase (Delta-12 desaturase)
MNKKLASGPAASGQMSWRQAVAGYQSADRRRSIGQLANTVVPYFVLWYVMVGSLEVSYWLTLALAVVAAAFLVRIFIFFHDCGHGSFFRSRKANDVVGIVTGVMTFTPYYSWRHSHIVHHATSGDLDRRGVGDVWTLTAREYLAAPWWKRLAYRAFRFPLVTFVVGPPLMFLFVSRIPLMSQSRQDRISVVATDLALLGIAALMSAIIGLKSYLTIQFPVMALASMAGVWMFYVQHQFEGTYWERHKDWDFVDSAMQGASYYRLPRVLQWFTGNIGFHHIHHLSPRIPNYKLQQCFSESILLQQVKPITLRSSLRSMHLRLWDEDSRQRVGFAALKRVPFRVQATG